MQRVWGQRFDLFVIFWILLAGLRPLFLGALALTNHGESVIAHLNDVAGGAWVTMAGGVGTLYALHLHKTHDRPPLERPPEVVDEVNICSEKNSPYI